MANPKKRRKLIVFSLIGAGLLALTLLAVLGKKEPVITVQTEKVIRTNLVERVVANGKIQPVLQVHISPEVSGEIIELPVKEGQHVNKGDLLLKIKPDFYIAALNQARAGYESALAGEVTGEANVEKAEADFKRNKELFEHKLISDADFIGFKTAKDIAAAQLNSARHQVESAKASVASAQDSLDKTTIFSPLTGTVSKLNSQLGERVLGTVQNAGTDIMIIADLNVMEARVDIGEMDVVLIQPGQHARLEVDSFKDRSFNGLVTDVANSSEGLNALGSGGSSSAQEATKFEVRLRVQEKEMFRPGMSVTAEIETRSQTNTLAVPFASVTARPPRPRPKAAAGSKTNSVAAADPPTNAPANSGTNSAAAAKTVDVVFVVDGDHVKMVPVKTGLSDDTHWEIVEGLKEGDEIVSGDFRAISHDLDDGKKITKGPLKKDEEGKKP